MEIKNLMIGDLVMDETINQQHKITVQDLFLVSDGLLDSNVFTPILITIEILKKNRLPIEISYEPPFVNMRVNVTRTGELQENHLCVYVKYVHELQHALRLCGLNDWADNFKI